MFSSLRNINSLDMYLWTFKENGLLPVFFELILVQSASLLIYSLFDCSSQSFIKKNNLAFCMRNLKEEKVTLNVVRFGNFRFVFEIVILLF